MNQLKAVEVSLLTGPAHVHPRGVSRTIGSPGSPLTSVFENFGSTWSKPMNASTVPFTVEKCRPLRWGEQSTSTLQSVISISPLTFFVAKAANLVFTVPSRLDKCISIGIEVTVQDVHLHPLHGALKPKFRGDVGIDVTLGAFIIQESIDLYASVAIR